MTHLCTIACALRLPADFVHDKHLDDMTQQLRQAGLLPVAVPACRWRLDTDSPGGYVLTFPVTLVVQE